MIFLRSRTNARGLSIAVRAATLFAPTVVACHDAGTSPTLAFRGWLFGPTFFVTPRALFNFRPGRANEVFSAVRLFPASLFFWTGVTDPARSPTTFGAPTDFATAYRPTFVSRLRNDKTQPQN